MPNRGNFGGGGRGGSRGGPPHINPDGDWICSQLDELKRSIDLLRNDYLGIFVEEFGEMIN